MNSVPIRVLGSPRLEKEVQPDKLSLTKTVRLHTSHLGPRWQCVTQKGEAILSVCKGLPEILRSLGAVSIKNLTGTPAFSQRAPSAMENWCSSKSNRLWKLTDSNWKRRRRSCSLTPRPKELAYAADIGIRGWTLNPLQGSGGFQLSQVLYIKKKVWELVEGSWLKGLWVYLRPVVLSFTRDK